MPELPEVETIRRGLEKTILHHSIERVTIRLAKQFHGDPSEIVGASVCGVRRYGKGLLIDLDNGYSLAIHVKMTGQLIYRKEHASAGENTIGILPNKHTHVIFHLLDPEGNRPLLYYNDQRQFGWIKVVRTDRAAELPFFKALGKEPLKDLTLADFRTLVSNAKTPIKLLIMDQTRIAGVGNIYANDALYRAQIHPKRPANSLSATEVKTLFDSLELVLKKGIEVGGASEWHYVDVLGGKGQYQNFFLVYGKDGEACPRCGTIIARSVVGGRGTFFCPHCQKLA